MITALPDSGSVVVPVADDWIASGTPGFPMRQLVETDGLKLRVMRVEPGAYADSHAHQAAELVYILDGDFYDDAGPHLPGDCIIRAAGASHVAGSRNGATLLLVYAGGAV
ncbi:hypothetical protein BH10PSE15_BH10PSE15_02040 [soil metagenome]